MPTCPRCGTPAQTAWLAEPAHCEKCNPYPCAECDGRYPDPQSADRCCRD